MAWLVILPSYIIVLVVNFILIAKLKEKMTTTTTSFFSLVVLDFYFYLIASMLWFYTLSCKNQTMSQCLNIDWSTSYQTFGGPLVGIFMIFGVMFISLLINIFLTLIPYILITIVCMVIDRKFIAQP